jgi:hypothetical protein
VEVKLIETESRRVAARGWEEGWNRGFWWKGVDFQLSDEQIPEI